MFRQECPRCERKCEVSKRNIELGILIKCECGATFEFMLGTTDRQRIPFFKTSSPTAEPPKYSQKNPSPPATSMSSRRPKLIWKGFALLTGLWLLLSFFRSFSLLMTVLPISLIFMCFFLMNRSSWKKLRDKTFGYFFFDKGVEFFISVNLVLGIYSIISWFVDGSNDTTTLHYLWRAEDFFTGLKSFLHSYLIFKPWTAALIIFMLILTDLILSYFFGSRRPDEVNTPKEKKPKTLAQHYLAYHKWSKRVYLVLVLFCSFTFFGNAVASERIAHVRVRIDAIRAGFAEAKDETEAILTSATQQRIYYRIDEYIGTRESGSTYHPKWETTYPKYYYDIVYDREKAISELRSKHTEIKNNPKVKIPRSVDAKIETILSRPTPREYSGPEPVPYAESVGPVKTQSQTGEVRQTKPSLEADPHPKNIENLSVEKVRKISASLKRQRFSRLVSFLKLSDSKEIAGQIPKSFTNVTKSQFWKMFTDHYPFLEPMLDVLVGAFDKTAEEEVKKGVDRLTESLIEYESISQHDFDMESEKVVENLKLWVGPESIKKTRELGSQITSVTSEARSQINEIEAQVRIAEFQQAVPPNLRVLQPVTCEKSAEANYRVRMAQAKSYQETLNAGRIHSKDLAALKNRETVLGLTPT